LEVDGSEKSPGHSRVQTCPNCGASWPIKPSPLREGYYCRARAWLAASPRVRVAISDDRARHFRRIAGLGDAWGLRLDELGAGYRMVRWAAMPRFIAEREARYRALVKLLEEHGAAWDLGRRFGELTRSMPKVGRQAQRKET
jgi:hypothetical protein